MNWTDPLFLCAAPSGILFLLIGWIMLHNPPKEINDLYGYRSSKSKKSQAAWDFSQVYSSKQMIKMGWVNLLVSIPGLFISFSAWLGLTIAITVLIGTCIVLFLDTEAKLKSKFGE